VTVEGERDGRLPADPVSSRRPAHAVSSRRPADAVFPIRLLALDIDGTLVGDDLVLRERTLEAVRAAVHRGVNVSIVTGRMISSALRFAEELDLRDPIVGFQGALIRAMPDRTGPRVGKLLVHRPLSAQAAREAVRWCRTRGLDPHVNHLERFIIRADDPNAEDYSAFLGARAELVPDIEGWIERPVTKVIAVGEAPAPITSLDPARRHFAGQAEVTVSHPRFIEWVAPGVSKGWAIRWLARRAGVPLAQVLAIGDQLNDLEMLGTAGHGVAMPSAPPAVRAAARYVAPPLTEEGSALIIEDLVLGGRRHAERSAPRYLAGEPR
jgi:Cof subfamily protein (haloacid dehalogenase superfamily)